MKRPNSMLSPRRKSACACCRPASGAPSRRTSQRATSTASSAQPGHHLVQQHDVEAVALELGQGVLAIRHGSDGETLLLEELDVGPQEVDLVIGPQDSAAGIVVHGIFGRAMRKALSESRSAR